MSPIETQGQSANATALNGFADRMLHGFGNMAVSTEAQLLSLRNRTSSSLIEVSTAIAASNNSSWKVNVNRMSTELDHSEKYLQRYLSPTAGPGPLARVVSTAGTIIDVATGLISYGKAVKQDLKSGDTSFKNSTTVMLGSVGRSAATFAVGSLVAGALTATAAPAVVVGTGAVALGTGTGYAINWIASQLTIEQMDSNP